MFKYLGMALVLVASLAGGAQAEVRSRVAGHISSQTTTAVVAAVASQTVYLDYASLCVAGNGATTGIKFVDTGGANLHGTNVVYVLLAGQCIEFTGDQISPTTGGTGLSITTTVGNGPVDFNVQSRQR